MKNASPRFFVDTNILAYAYDQREGERLQRAQDVLTTLRAAETGVISTQVLSELYSAMTKPRGLNLPAEAAEASVLNYLRSWPVYEVKPMHVLEAMRGVREHKLSYYDALIWATAKLNGIQYLLSEDGQDGRYLEGVRILNPLDPAFDLSALS
jgi:predicted nucleic acid-binding protein